MSQPPDPIQHPLLPILRDLTEATPYAHGALDVLRLLGLVAVEEGNAVPTGTVAEMMLASLAAHAADRVTVRFDWDRLAGDGLRGVDIIRAMEEARAARLLNPTPGRTVRVVQAIIKARRGAEDVFLMQYDPEAGRYQPLGGKIERQDVSADAALRRELSEELGLTASPNAADCALSLIKQGWEITEISATYGILTRYSIDYFAVSGINFPIRQDADTRWITLREIAKQRADDDRIILHAYQQALGLDLLASLPPAIYL